MDFILKSIALMVMILMITRLIMLVASQFKTLKNYGKKLIGYSRVIENNKHVTESKKLIATPAPH